MHKLTRNDTNGKEVWQMIVICFLTRVHHRDQEVSAGTADPQTAARQADHPAHACLPWPKLSVPQGLGPFFTCSGFSECSPSETVVVCPF